MKRIREKNARKTREQSHIEIREIDAIPLYSNIDDVLNATKHNASREKRDENEGNDSYYSQRLHTLQGGERPNDEEGNSSQNQPLVNVPTNVLLNE
jgi:hypothetical protein